MKDGKLLKEKMLGSHVTLDNLLGQLRLKGAVNLSELDSIVLEPYGKISIIKKPEALPLTRKQMNLPDKQVGFPTIIIYNGKEEKRNLQQLGLGDDWLKEKLAEKGIENFKDVFLATLEVDGTVYISV